MNGYSLFLTQLHRLFIFFYITQILAKFEEQNVSKFRIETNLNFA